MSLVLFNPLGWPDLNMKFYTIESDSNYVATIVKLPELQKVEGLDNLMLANVFWYGCLVSKDSVKDVPYVFFPAETVLSPKFLYHNSLYRDSMKNQNEKIKWFFDDNWRVKAIKFKWVISSGFLIPALSLIEFTWSAESANSLEIGTTFHNINGKEVCWKYRRPVAPDKLTKSQRMSKRLEKFDIVIPNQFRFHADTPQFLRFVSDFKHWDSIVITEKLHWTSAVFSNVLTKRKISLLERLSKYLWIHVRETEYYHLYSSRSVIKNDNIDDERNTGWGYYWEDLWWFHARMLEEKIEKWITLYWEIVWYTESWQWIQKWYHYGCKPCESKFYCYRITYTTADGVVIEFTDNQIRQYCSLRWIEVVPLLQELTINKESFERLTNVYPKIIEVMCSMNEWKVPREWVVIRRDGQETYSAYKLKSQLFLTHETKMIDTGWEDLESNS